MSTASSPKYSTTAGYSFHNFKNYPGEYVGGNRPGTVSVEPSRAYTLRSMNSQDCSGMEYCIGFIDNLINNTPGITQDQLDILAKLNDDICRSLDEFDYELVGHNHARITSVRRSFLETLSAIPGVAEGLKEHVPATVEEKPRKLNKWEVELEQVFQALGKN